MNEVQLPDYLPSRYKNWMDLHFEVVRIFHEQGRELNNETQIRLYELGGWDEIEGYDQEVINFYQEFPFVLIKARAFDFVISNLPTKAMIYNFAKNGHIDNNSNKVIDMLFKICPE